MAYAAVVSLIQIVENILDEQYQIPWDEQQIKSLLETMCCFHDFLTSSWKKRSSVARCLERKIRDAAYKAEDAIESYISNHFFTKNDEERLRSSKIVTQHLKIVLEEIESIKLKVTRLVDSWEGAEDFNYTHSLPLASGGDYTMLGFEDDSLQLLGRIVGQPSKKLRIIPVVGMGGIGKTTLVKNVFKKSIEYPFDVTAWVTVSQNYRERDILLGLLESMRILTGDMYQRSDGELSDRLHKSLIGNRYLIVMDDMWHKEAWGNVKRLFPDDNNGSRVLLTTRLSDVAAYANSFKHDHHHMRLLNENESWDLFCAKVFRDGRCLPELVEVGKEIVRSCKGLPLSIVVISGLLSNVSRTQRAWEYIAKNLNTVLISKDRQCSELLSLSYHHLPHHLKACFLYAGVYPDLEFPISKLIKLWIAEGFIKPNSSKSLEEVGEEYLDDLMSRNLVLVGEKRFNGKIKSCIVHDLLREWCSSKALDEKFIHTLNANICYRQEIPNDTRRLCIHKDSADEARADILRKIINLSLVRSLVSQSKPHDELWSRCKLLRVLDLSNVDLGFFPFEVIYLVHLRYVYVCCELEIYDIHISKYLPDSLRNLQTLIICQRHFDSSVHLPPGFWRLRHLRHLQFGTCNIPRPQKGNENLVLESLQTLTYVSSSSCTEEFIKRIPNLKKLGIRVDERTKFPLGHLVNLHKLETLKCIVEPRSYVAISRELTLPQNLKKLTLKGTRIPWKYMSIVGSLTNLEILKLKDDAFEGLVWDSKEGEFGLLVYLLIEGTDLQHWSAAKNHFPRLQRLTIWECTNLEKIPPDFGYIPTLQSIELDDASPSAAESARQMIEEQKRMGNEELQVWVHDLWKHIKSKGKERRKEAERRRQEAMEKRRKERDNRKREAEDRMRKQEAEFLGQHQGRQRCMIL